MCNRAVERRCVPLQLVSVLVPLLFSVGASAWLDTVYYHKGNAAQRELLSFAFIKDAATLFVLLLLIAALASVVLLRYAKGLSKGQLWVPLAGIALVTFISPFLWWGVAGRAFELGRNQAYATVDPKLLVEACGVVLQEHGSVRPVIIYEGSAEFESLPSYIRSLHPRLVYLERGGVVVQLGGGGPATHEGLFVAPASVGDPQRYARRLGLELVQAKPPVFRYRLYDFRMLYGPIP